MATSSRLKRSNTSNNLLVRSGPCKITELRDTPLNTAEESKTTLARSGLRG
ncbi:hypothetical protein DPMN_096251 [Dreissena polymorpha]|uniref:Uncharacterized protein n=1 Tax=Dreissena polymorpha TaxID=45954 RepID=A0A9D4L9D9_DREPO|nr:hypothetical protein DPMN_096251 [Dreissena polymorpha]